MPKIYVDNTMSDEDWEFCYSNHVQDPEMVHLSKDLNWVNLIDNCTEVIEYHKVEDIPNLIKALAAAYKQSTGKSVGLAL